VPPSAGATSRPAFHRPDAPGNPEAMRTVSVVVWSLIVAGLAFAVVVGAAGGL
jgi:hypothetical protein